MGKIGSFFISAAKRTGNLELTEFFTSIAAIIFFPIVGIEGAWYLIAIIVACDIFRFFIRGAWYHAKAHRTAHWHNPSKDVPSIVLIAMKTTAPILIAILRLPEFFDINMSFKLLWARVIIWYLVTILTVIETARCLLHTLHKYDSMMLFTTEGRIGLPNWISIIRIAVSLVIPHIYLTQCFSRQSNLIAVFVLLFTIGTDALDGVIARTTYSVTKAGKYLDPLADKVFFVSNAAAFILLRYQDSVATGSNRMLKVTIAFVGIAVLRDLIFVFWYFFKGCKLEEGISASLIDKLRMGSICAWFLASAFSLAIPISQVRVQMVKTSIGLIIAVAVLSIISIYVDYERAKILHTKTLRLRQLR